VLPSNSPASDCSSEVSLSSLASLRLVERLGDVEPNRLPLGVGAVGEADADLDVRESRRGKSSALAQLCERLAGHHAFDQRASGTLFVAITLERDRGPDTEATFGLCKIGHVGRELAARLLVGSTTEQQATKQRERQQHSGSRTHRGHGTPDITAMSNPAIINSWTRVAMRRIRSFPDDERARMGEKISRETQNAISRARADE
jgi:hypothetical protein